jgi:hypothetical protein
VEKKNGRPGQATDDNITWRMRIACRIPKATNTHSQYVIIIVFPLQQLLHERVSLLRYTYIACLVLMLGGSNWSASRSGPFTPCKEPKLLTQ